MRYIVIGAGAIGATIGARLFEAGRDVVLVARGAHLAAIRADGLTFGTPAGTSTLPIAAVAGPAELTLGRDDVLLICVKLQDAQPLLDEWSVQPVVGGRSAGEDLPIFCVQNGVDGERMALRRFARVYGVCVMLPATHLQPGQVEAYGDPVTGILTLGQYPSGTDEFSRKVAADLEASSIKAPVSDRVMRWKYTKLLANLGNALEAVVGPDVDGADDLHRRAGVEGRAVLAAAGIDHATPEEDAEMRRPLKLGAVQGSSHGGGSSWQSLTRGTGSIEADYLSGEIVLLGRLHGVPTPVNATLQRLANRAAREGISPGTVSVAELAGLIDRAT